MPINLPHRDPDTGELRDMPHFDIDEVAAMLHVSPTHVRRRSTGTGQWPHLRLAHRVWFSAEHVERIIELSTIDPDRIPEGEDIARLGTLLSDTDLEGVR